MYNYRGYQIPQYHDLHWDVPLDQFMRNTIDFMIDTELLFEYINKNIKAYPYQASYSGENISSITYTLPSGTFVKTYTYTGENLTKVNIIGPNLPTLGLNKNISYDGNGNISTVSYN